MAWTPSRSFLIFEFSFFSVPFCFLMSRSFSSMWFLFCHHYSLQIPPYFRTESRVWILTSWASPTFLFGA